MRPIDADELYARLMKRYLMHNMKNDQLDMVARSVIESCMEAVNRSKTLTMLLAVAGRSYRKETDMDYKGLIDLSRNGSVIDILSHSNETATAIETLLAEREDSRLTPKMVTCPGGWKGTRLTRYYCPQCKKAVRNDEAYCHKCGQAILFPKLEYDKENNKICLNFEQGEWRGPQKGGGDG